MKIVQPDINVRISDIINIKQYFQTNVNCLIVILTIKKLTLEIHRKKIFQCAENTADNLEKEEESIWGLAIAFAISALVNLALLISPRTRETILSLGQRLINRTQTVRANPQTDSTFSDPPSTVEASKPQGPPPTPPPQTPQQPAIVWPTVRPSAPPPPPRVLSYGAKGIFETGN